MNPTSRKNLLYLFDKLKSFDRKVFTLEELNTSYKNTTLKKYLTTYLEGYCKKVSPDKWSCDGIDKLTCDQFLILMSQKNINHLNSDISSRLIIRSKEAFLSSLVIYNNPLQPYRLESFLMLLLNAWELLLKYEIVMMEGDKFIYKDKDRKNTISLSTCINKQLKENDPIRDNLEFAVNLRNKATHFIIPEIHPILSRLLYPTVHNFIEKYASYMNEFPLASTEGLISMIIDEKPFDQPIIIKKYGNRTASDIFEMLTKIENKAKEINSDKFFISFEYKLSLIKNGKKADINLINGNEGASIGLLETTIPINRKYPFKSKELLAHINDKIRPGKVNQHHLNGVNYVYNIKQNNLYYYLNENVSRYSQRYANWFIQEYLNGTDWMTGVLKEYKRRSNKNYPGSRKMDRNNFDLHSTKTTPT